MYTNIISRKITQAVDNFRFGRIPLLRYILSCLLLYSPPVMGISYELGEDEAADVLISSFVIPIVRVDIMQSCNSERLTTYLNIVYASLWAGSFTFGSFRRS